MANQDHLNILRQGVDVWNQWRREHPDILPDLSEANLSCAQLSGIRLGGAHLARATLDYADLSLARLREANFRYASLIEVDLSETNLRCAHLAETRLLSTNFRDANLSQANLSNAVLIGADLRDAQLHDALLPGADLRDAIMGETKLGHLDLSHVIGLGQVRHYGPSTISIDTFYRSHGLIPEVFLQGAGVPDSFLTYARSFSGKPIDFYSCFISCSSRDQDFAERLYADLQSHGVRCWFAPEDLKIGDHYHQRIDESIRFYDKLVLVLSEHAVQSAWVEREVVSAREKEDQLGRTVLFPLRLDDAVMHTTNAWAADVRRRQHMGDFTRWKHHDAYQQAFERLLRDLKADG